MVANLRFIAALVVLTGIVSCKKEAGPAIFILPAATTAGLNTFGFEVGTEVFVNHGNVCITADSCRPNFSASYQRGNGEVMVQAEKVLRQNGSISSSEVFAIYISTDHRGARVYDSQLGDIISMAYDYQKGSDRGGYMLDIAKPNSVVALTKIDTTAGILSGTFSAHLFRRTTSGFSVISTDSIVINNGRFDMKYK